MHMYVYIYIYIYMYTHTYHNIYIYIYMYMYHTQLITYDCRALLPHYEGVPGDLAAVLRVGDGAPVQVHLHTLQLHDTLYLITITLSYPPVIIYAITLSTCDHII